MKIGIIGVGAVGTACIKTLLLRGSCDEIILIDLIERRATGVLTDLSHGESDYRRTRMKVGNYSNLKDSNVIVITAGINEKAGAAINRDDSAGRLRLLGPNALTYKNIVEQIAIEAPDVPILVVTDPPDPLADVARAFTKTNPIISTGTYLDSRRFRLQLARQFNCHPSSVNAMVLGEHGTSAVYVWSSAKIGGESVLDLIERKGKYVNEFKSKVEKAVKFANIDIIEGTGASQHGIGFVTARIVEAILRDEGLVEPLGKYHEKYSSTLSLPSIIGKGGIREVLEPSLSSEEEEAIKKSGKIIEKSFIDLKKENPKLFPNEELL